MFLRDLPDPAVHHELPVSLLEKRPFREAAVAQVRLLLHLSSDRRDVRADVPRVLGRHEGDRDVLHPVGADRSGDHDHRYLRTGEVHAAAFYAVFRDRVERAAVRTEDDPPRSVDVYSDPEWRDLLYRGHDPVQ